MNLTKWYPSNRALQLGDDFDRMVDRVFGNWIAPIRGAEREVVFVPTVDVVDRGKEILVRAEIPGLSPEDVKVTCEEDHLVLSGEKKLETEHKGENVYRFESRFGSFHRVVPLPAAVKASDARATFKKGVLEVVLPKAEPSKGQEVKIKVSD